MPDLPDATYLTDFHAYRAEHDPDGLFANAYTDRVLGPAR